MWDVRDLREWLPELLELDRGEGVCPGGRIHVVRLRMRVAGGADLGEQAAGPAGRGEGGHLAGHLRQEVCAYVGWRVVGLRGLRAAELL